MPRLVRETAIAQRSPTSSRSASARSWYSSASVVVAAVLGHDAEVGEQAADAGRVAEPLADRQARLVALDGASSYCALLRGERAGEVMHLRDAGLVVGGARRRRPPRPAAPPPRRSAPARRALLGERGLAPRPASGVAELLGDAASASRVDRLGTLPVARQLDAPCRAAAARRCARARRGAGRAARSSRSRPRSRSSPGPPRRHARGTRASSSCSRCASSGGRAGRAAGRWRRPRSPRCTPPTRSWSIARVANGRLS